MSAETDTTESMRTSNSDEYNKENGVIYNIFTNNMIYYDLEFKYEGSSHFFKVAEKISTHLLKKNKCVLICKHYMNVPNQTHDFNKIKAYCNNLEDTIKYKNILKDTIVVYSTADSFEL